MNPAKSLKLKEYAVFFDFASKIIYNGGTPQTSLRDNCSTDFFLPQKKSTITEYLLIFKRNSEERYSILNNDYYTYYVPDPNPIPTG